MGLYPLIFADRTTHAVTVAQRLLLQVLLVRVSDLSRGLILFGWALDASSLNGQVYDRPNENIPENEGPVYYRSMLIGLPLTEKG